MKKHNNPYLRFLGLVETLDRLLPGAKLDMIEEALLNQIMLSADFGKTILVGDLVNKGYAQPKSPTPHHNTTHQSMLNAQTHDTKENPLDG